MDVLETLDEEIRRNRAAADHYQAPAKVQSIQRRDVQLSRHQDPTTWVTGTLQRLFVQVAEDHAGCASLDCRTCASLREGLTVSLTALQWMRGVEVAATCRTA